MSISPRPWRFFLSFALVASVLVSAKTGIWAAENLDQGFANPPASAKPRVYWFWLFNRVDKAGITRDLEQFKAKGISGVNLICNGGYAGVAPLPGVTEVRQAFVAPRRARFLLVSSVWARMVLVGTSQSTIGNSRSR